MPVGIDVLEPDRLRRALERRPRLAARLFTDAEIAYARSRARPHVHLAARFCAKEAVTKALALDVFSPREVEVVGGGDAATHVRLHGVAAERAEALGVRVSVSMSHVARMAAAVAIAEPAGKES